MHDDVCHDGGDGGDDDDDTEGDCDEFMSAGRLKALRNFPDRTCEV